MTDEGKRSGDAAEPASSRGLTRRHALGAGAAVLGGLALGELARPGKAGASIGTTKLAAAVAAGDTNLKVVGVDGFSVGTTIWVDTGTLAEPVQVMHVGTEGKTGTGIDIATPGADGKLTGGLAHGHERGVVVSVTPPVSTPATQFPDALKRLVNDTTYAGAALQQPQKLLTDYPKLSLLELDELRSVAILSGADVTAVNQLRGQSMLDHSADPGYFVGPFGGRDGWFPMCCCSCCCRSTS